MEGTFLSICILGSIQVISSQHLSSADMIGSVGIPDIAITDAIIGPNIALASNMPHGPNMPLGPNVPLGPNLGINNMAMAANNMALASNMAIGANRAVLGPVGPARAGGMGLTGISPAAMTPPMGLAASHGGGFAVTSSSPIAPTGLTVTSENTIEGPLIVAGQLPFLGTVALDGAYPTNGIGAVTYGCGDGNIGMVNEGIAAPPAVPVMNQGFAPALSPGLNYNGLGGRVGLGGFGSYY